MRRPTNPRSPVQSVGNLTDLWPILVFVVAATAYVGWRQWDLVVDWFDGELGRASSGPRPAKANLAAIFSTDDYPLDALRRDEQGTVGFRLTINRRGGVIDCNIVSSSGSDTLDDATCEILERRAHFTPARDTAGKRVPDQATGRIRWELPAE